MLRLHTAINQADFVSWWKLYTRAKVTKCIPEKMALYFGGWIINIHQDTKSAEIGYATRYLFNKYITFFRVCVL